MLSHISRTLLHAKRWAHLPLRLVVGYGFVAHGIAKLLRGPGHFSDVLEKLGVPFPHLASWATIATELLGGLAVLAGAFVSVVSIPMIAVLLVAAMKVHLAYGFSSIKLKDVTAGGPVFGMPGYELDLLYIAALVLLAIGGPGPFAIQDAALTLRGSRAKRLTEPRFNTAVPYVTATRPVPDSDQASIRPTHSGDAAGIARRFLESAEFHAGFDERYATPSLEAITSRYEEGKQHFAAKAGEAITLVAEVHGEVVGFVDARLEKSSDPMHRDLVYCYIADIAVSPRFQGEGVGTMLLQAAEGWGRQQGAEFASLEYHVANTRAASFYERRMAYRVVSKFAIKPL